jgi:DHA2 family multidrug resistance protein
MERSNTIAQGIIARTGDVSGAGTKAVATINNIVTRQAYYLSYLDTFRLITIFFILVIPLVAFLRVKKKSKAEVAAAMKAAADAH